MLMFVRKTSKSPREKSTWLIRIPCKFYAFFIFLCDSLTSCIIGSDFDSLCFVFFFVGVINSRTKGPTVNHAMVGCAKATIAVQGACHHHSTGETTIADPSQVILDGMDLAVKTHTDDSIDDFSHSYIGPLKYLTFGSLLFFFVVCLCIAHLWQIWGKISRQKKTGRSGRG
jgi:hypothetical protein